MSGKFALIIGNTEYSDPGLAQLTAPGKDTEDFAHVLKDQAICAFDDVNILLNQPEYIVREAIEELFDQKKPDDLLILYFSGHGVRDEFGALYLAVKNTNRFRLRSTAIKSDFIREAMDQSRSKRQVLILDCCNSGAFAQGTKAAVGVSIGTASAFESGYGRIILTASDSTQFAWEGDKVIGDTDNSLFTHFLVEGLKGEADLDGDGYITVDELYDYAYEKVRLATPKQTPSKFSSKQQGEIVLRQSMRIEDIKRLPLPTDLIAATENTITFVREGAVRQLENLLKGKNRGLARSAEDALKRIAAEDDSYRLRQLAAQILDLTQQGGLGRTEDPVEELVPRDENAGLEKQKTEFEQNTQGEANRPASQRSDEEGLKKPKTQPKRAARQKAKAETKVRDLTNPLTAPKVEGKRPARKVGERKILLLQRTKLNELLAHLKVVWENTPHYLRNIPYPKSRIYGLSTLAIVAVVAFVFYRQFGNDRFYFSGTSGRGVDIYFYASEETAISQDTGEGDDWSPAAGAFGRLYFTSNRDGKAEIYELKSSGEVERLTHTPGPWESWSPTFGAFGRLYFTSNRDGKAEIYELKSSGEVERLTHTPGPWESWSPTIDAFGRLYFTSNRDGKAEVYEFTSDGEIQRLTFTPEPWESWSPAVAVFGRLFFTSNRSGKAEIYEFASDGEVQQYTHTPDSAESWSPVIRGEHIYFTSDRDGDNRVYRLASPQATAIVSFEGWTTRTIERLPFPDP